MWGVGEGIWRGSGDVRREAGNRRLGRDGGVGVGESR